MSEWVQMIHPDSKVMAGAEPPLVTKEAFDQVWKKNGWKLASKGKAAVDEPPAETPAAPVTPRKSTST